MADYTYIGSGGAETLGCAEVSMKVYYVYPYGEGSIVFLRYKAERGVLEKIAIKRVLIRQNAKTGGAVLFLYQDTLNALFNESDLCTQEEAVAIATAYYEKVQADALKAVRYC